MTRFEKWIAATGSVIAAGGLLVGYANYKHTLDRDKEQQIADMFKASTTPPVSLPNITTKPVENAVDKQPEKELERPIEQGQHNPADSSPLKVPKAPPKEEPKPFTFWGYLPAGQGQTARPGIMFQVNSCVVGQTLVTCIMTATSPHYDRQIYFNMSTTTITDSEGDVFRVQLRSFTPLQLDRDAPVPFKLEFPVNKNLAEPIVVRLNGYDTNAGNIQNASFRITSK